MGLKGWPPEKKGKDQASEGAAPGEVIPCSPDDDDGGTTAEIPCRVPFAAMTEEDCARVSFHISPSRFQSRLGGSAQVLLMGDQSCWGGQQRKKGAMTETLRESFDAPATFWCPGLGQHRKQGWKRVVINRGVLGTA